MTRKELFKSLNNLCEEMNFSYNINCGGCCFVAAVIAKQLEIYNIPFKVSATYSPTHYWIKVSDRYINRDGFHAEEILNWNSHSLYDFYYANDWNYYYNRKWNLIVETRIKSLFNKYGNKRTRLCNEVI